MTEKGIFDKNNIKVAAFDLDGTLMYGGNEPTEKTRASLHALSKSGVVVVAATGRDMAQVSDSLRSCFDFIVSANGALVQKVQGTGLQTISKHTLESKEVPLILRFIEICGGGACAFRFGQQVFSRLSWKRLSYCFSEDKKKRLKPDEYSNEYLHVRTWREVDFEKRPSGKIQALFPNSFLFDYCVKKLREKGKYEVLRMADNYLELTPIGITKAHGLDELCDYLGCSTGNLISFGDSVNDLDMLKNSAYSVAMGNASDEVKSICSFVAPSVYDDGVSRMIEKLFLNP